MQGFIAFPMVLDQLYLKSSIQDLFGSNNRNFDVIKPKQVHLVNQKWTENCSNISTNQMMQGFIAFPMVLDQLYLKSSIQDLFGSNDRNFDVIKPKQVHLVYQKWTENCSNISTNQVMQGFIAFPMVLDQLYLKSSIQDLFGSTNRNFDVIKPKQVHLVYQKWTENCSNISTNQMMQGFIAFPMVLDQLYLKSSIQDLFGSNNRNFDVIKPKQVNLVYQKWTENCSNISTNQMMLGFIAFPMVLDRFYLKIYFWTPNCVIEALKDKIMQYIGYSKVTLFYHTFCLRIQIFKLSMLG